MQDRATPLFRLLGAIKDSLNHLAETISAYQESESRQRDGKNQSESRTESCLPIEITKCYESEERERPVRNSREKTRTTLEVIGVIAAITLAGLTFCTLRTLNGQLGEARVANKNLERQLEANDRPWVSLTAEPSTPLTYKNGAISVGFSFNTTNIGRSPAENLSIDATLILGTKFEEWNERQEEICKGIAMQEKVGSVSGYILFPGSPPGSQEIGLILSKGDVDSFWKTYPPDVPHKIIPIGLIGCVDYTYESSPTHHQTGIMFELMMLPNKTVVDVSKSPIPPQSIFRMGWPSMKYFAN